MRTDFTSMAAIGTGAVLGLVGTAALFAGSSHQHMDVDSCITVRSLAPEMVASIEASITPEIQDVIVRVPRPAVAAVISEGEVAEVAEAPEAPSAPKAPEAVTARTISISEDVQVRGECVAEIAEMREQVERVRMNVRRDAEVARERAVEMRLRAEELRGGN